VFVSHRLPHQIYDGKTGDRVCELPTEHDGSVFSISWSDDGSKVRSVLRVPLCIVMCVWHENADSIAFKVSFRRQVVVFHSALTGTR
jgi:hypothetical protein